eukprot:13496267-Ditylum_brightwellii.AAC.1
MGQTIHHKFFNGNDSPACRLARHVHYILSNRGTANFLLCTVYENNTTAMIDPSNKIKLICVVVRNLKLPKAGIDPDLIGVHLLCTGAMTLKFFRCKQYNNNNGRPLVEPHIPDVHQ